MWQDSPAPHLLSGISINLHKEGEEGQEPCRLLPHSHPSLEAEDDAIASLSSSGIWVPDHIVLHSPTSVTHHVTLLPHPSLLSFLGLPGDTPVPFPELTVAV